VLIFYVKPEPLRGIYLWRNRKSEAKSRSGGEETDIEGVGGTKGRDFRHGLTRKGARRCIWYITNPLHTSHLIRMTTGPYERQERGGLPIPHWRKICLWRGI